MYYARKAVINDSFPGIFVSGKTLVLSFFWGNNCPVFGTYIVLLGKDCRTVLFRHGDRMQVVGVH